MKKEINTSGEQNENNFFEKLKDKKYKAKVELLLGFGLLMILVIYANVAGIENSYNYSYTNTTTQTKENNKETFILDKISDNYAYDINIVLTTTQSNDNNTNSNNIQPLAQHNYSYNGKTYKNNTIINKVVDNSTETFYQVDNEYYKEIASNLATETSCESCPTNNNYTIAKMTDIYDLVDQKYLSLDTIKNYINKASLDHTTNYSNGNTSYVYMLKVKEIIKTYSEENDIKLEISIENEIPTIVIDYTNLLNTINSNINECKVTIKYTNINEVEEFTIINDQTVNNIN